jgi:metal-responsive CopG/Arc/MetJ family transcriptional regulator
MGAVRMNISLPEKVAKKLRKSVKPRERSAVIAEALNQYFRQKGKENLMQELIEGYKASAQADRETEEWLGADLGEMNDEY